MSKSNEIKFTFVHIPKNAGTSIETLIEQKKVPNFEYVGHRFFQKKIKSDTIKVCIFRDPIDRFISAFYYSKREHPKSPSHRKFDNPNQLIDGLRQIEHPKHKAAMAYVGNKNPHNYRRFLKKTIPHKVGGVRTQHTWVFEHQITWYKHMLNNDKTIYLDFDNLAEEFNSLIQTYLNSDSKTKTSKVIKLPHKNSTQKNKKFSSENLTPPNIQYLKDYYREDYVHIEKIKELYTLDKQLKRVLKTDNTSC